jgi:hypothetical protein
MTKLKTIFILSFLIFILPFLGFPQFFDDILSVVFGVAIFTSAYLLKKDLDEKRYQSSDQGGSQSRENNE